MVVIRTMKAIGLQMKVIKVQSILKYKPLQRLKIAPIVYKHFEFDFCTARKCKWQIVLQLRWALTMNSFHSFHYLLVKLWIGHCTASLLYEFKMGIELYLHFSVPFVL